MGDTSIEWTDKTWSPIRAKVKEDAHEIATLHGWKDLAEIALKMAGHVGPHCEMCSHGCNHCYSLTNNGRCLPSNGTGLPFDKRSRELVDIFIDAKILQQSFHWKKPRKIFVENQSDLFGEWVPFEMIDKVFAVMALCPQHTFQCLTKRAERMREYCSDVNVTHRVAQAMDSILVDQEQSIADRIGISRSLVSMIESRKVWPDAFVWPLPNVWLGVSAEDQQRADERIPPLLETPAAKRFVSYEPALGPVNFQSIRILAGHLAGEIDCRINWIIAGGESGPGARPPQAEWFRSARDQARAIGAAYFFKQYGAWAPRSVHGEKPLSRTRGDMVRVGKKKAGALLDGREWKEFPA